MYRVRDGKSVSVGTKSLMLGLVCVLLGGIVSEGGAARAQAPAPPVASAPVAPTPAAAPPSPEETILALKDTINQKDMQIANLIAQGVQCRTELLKAERADVDARKAQAKPADPKAPSKAPAPAAPPLERSAAPPKP